MSPGKGFRLWQLTTSQSVRTNRSCLRFGQRDPRGDVAAPRSADTEVEGQPRVVVLLVAVVAATGAVLTAWRTRARRA